MSRAISRGYNTLVLSTDVTWALSSTASTPQNIDIALPDVLNGDNQYQFLISSPSTQTVITAIAKVAWVDSSTTTRYAEVERWQIDAADDVAAVVQGVLMSSAGRLTLLNDSAVSTGATVTAYVQIRAL